MDRQFCIYQRKNGVKIEGDILGGVGVKKARLVDWAAMSNNLFHLEKYFR